MSFYYSQFTRLIPSGNSLNIILKNTHFKDDLLDENRRIMLKVEYNDTDPILSVEFQESLYDFQEVLKSGDFLGDRGLWLKSDNLVIKLTLADSVISDKVSTRSFTLDAEESQKLKALLNRQ